MKITAQPVYTSIACNRTTEIVDWNSNGHILFGATNSVVIYNTTQKGGDPLAVLTHHRAKVNSVKWLQKLDGTCTEFLSCSADKTAAIWTQCHGVFTVSSQLEGHTDGVTSIGGTYLNENDLIVFTASIDSSVKLWERRNGMCHLKQTISLHSGLCLTLHCHLLPKVNKPVLFLALDDHKVHIYSASSVASAGGDNEEFHRLHVLVGHEDWVRGLDVQNLDDNTILVASCSQDTYIRLWCIQRHSLLVHPVNEIRVEERLFKAYGEDWAVSLDAVLAGHEGWVYGVQWAPRSFDKATNTWQPSYRLLSSSLDKTVIVWEPETPQSAEGMAHPQGAWVERVRVGEVGGSGLGFYGSRFGPEGRSFVAHGYNGSFHVWTFDEESSEWRPAVVCGGHFGSVEDLCWAPGGAYLASVSTDQTTRIHAPWIGSHESRPSWHEVARPQVHGYDLASLALVFATTLVSAAEEKVLRVFSAPHNFLDNFKNITGAPLVAGTENGTGPEGASVPSLGLSNKAVFTSDEGPADENDGYFVPVCLREPPTEETLAQHTLWPEQHKLYGHGYEVFAVAAAPDRRLVASACKATVPEHAAVLIWETETWQQIQKLVYHQLTVTQMAFSPDSQRLLTVSRDRRWSVHRRLPGADTFTLEAATDKINGVHSRIIWCCAWAHDGEMFGTGSRDGKVCAWSESSTDSSTSLGRYALVGVALELPGDSVTALAWAPVPARVLAVGLDCGRVRLYAQPGHWNLLHQMDNSFAHHLTVKRLTFRPWSQGQDDTELMLASCGSDHFVRIYNIVITDVTT